MYGKQNTVPFLMEIFIINNTNKCININCDKFHKKIREAFEKTVSVQFSCSVMRQFKGYNLAVRSKRRPL